MEIRKSKIKYNKKYKEVCENDEDDIKINAILNIIKTVSSIIFPLITFPYISRILKPENIGKINFSYSFVTYFILIASLGILTHAVRECSRVREDKAKLEKVASEIFSINVCSTVISYLMMFLILIFFRKFDSYRMLIFIQSSIILFVTLGCDWINTTFEDFKYITIRTVLVQLVSLILMFLFVREQEDYIIYTVISTFASCGSNIINIFYRKKYCKISFTLKMNLKKHLKPIMVLFSMIIAQTIFSSSDITMLGLIKDDFQVGLYSTAVKISNIICQIATSLVWVLLPKLTMYYDEKKYDKVNEILRKVLNILLVIGLPCATGCICLSKEIIFIIAGEEYVGATIPLCILMISFLFTLFGESFLGNMILLPAKKEKIYMKICMVATIINILLNFILIPKWGCNAAAITTALSTFFMLIMFILKKDDNIKIDNVKECIKGPFCGSVIIIIFCLVVKLIIFNFVIRLIIGIIGSIILYLIILILCKDEFCVATLNSLYEKFKFRDNMKNIS